jgi:hypothetical protein
MKTNLIKILLRQHCEKPLFLNKRLKGILSRVCIIEKRQYRFKMLPFRLLIIKNLPPVPHLLQNFIAQVKANIAEYHVAAA